MNQYTGWHIMFKFSFLLLLTLLSFSRTVFGQLSVESIGYIFPVDSAEIERFREASNEFQTYYKYGGYRKTEEIFPNGSFMGMKINHIPPPSNFSALYMSRDGSILPTTKELVDSLFMKAFLDSSFSIESDEVFLYYMLLTRSGYLVDESSDLLSFQQSVKDKFDSYRKEQENMTSDSLAIQTTFKYSYNRAFRTIYEYRFYCNSNGDWVRPPEKIELFKEVGPLNYWR
ncbi:hypothetical protein O3Q51_10050 [Cryomorphaceae bacterium 1068]|nr:hypothetical protein [Cryomorphaceae bacterium 1068]